MHINIPSRMLSKMTEAELKNITRLLVPSLACDHGAVAYVGPQLPTGSRT